MLLAEDNPVNQEVAIGLLETLNCAVTVVENGKEAVEAAAGGVFDLVLMDCQMPVMGGLEATQAIRAADDRDKRLPIVALTANDFEGARAECVAAGMDDLLGKPFSRQDLFTLLQRWRPAPAAPQPAAPAAAAEPRTSSLDPVPLETLQALDPGGERGLLQRAITKFVDYADESIARLADVVNKGDVADVSRIVHSLKSSSANLGAADVARQCAELEKLTADGALPDDIDQRLTALQNAHEAAKRDLLLLAEA